MSELETSAEDDVRREQIKALKRMGMLGVVQTIKMLTIERDSFKRIAGEVDAMLGKVAAERDALAARVAKAEGMAEALEKAVADLTYGAEKARTQKAAHSLFAASAEARTALAAWRAAAAAAAAKEVGDG